MVVHTCNPNSKKAEARRTAWASGQPGLCTILGQQGYVESLSLKQTPFYCSVKVNRNFKRRERNES